MRPVHYITLFVAVGLIALLYFAGDTTPPAKKVENAAPMAGNMAQGTTHMVKAASFDSILDAARKQLPGHALSEIAGIEKELGAISDSSHMAPVFKRLSQTWKQHKQLPVAAFYNAEAAKLENSQKNLTFAGQFFLDLMHETASQSVQAWEAQQAIACFQRSLELDPDNDTTKMALAAAYIEGVGETMQGVQLLLGITREKPDNIPANLMLGRLSIQSGQYDKALQRYETVLKNEPENTEALYFMAEAYKGKGEKEKAIELLEKCKKIVNKPEFSKDIDAYIKSFQ